MAISIKTPEQIAATTNTNATVNPSSADAVSGRKWKYFSRPTGSLSDLEFVDLNSIKKHAIILLIGDDGTGKTSFATRYAPDPLVVVSFDGRSRQAVKEAQEMGRKVDLIEINVTHKSLPPDQMKLHAREVVERAMYVYETLIEESKRDNVRTILFPDTATEYSEILKLAYDGTIEITKEGAKGTDKDFIARQWWRIFNLARNESNAHLIVTSRMTEIWKDDKPTGSYKAKCSRAVSSGVDLTMQIRLKTTFGIPKPEFEILVTNPKTNIVELGNVYDAKMWDKFGGPFVYSCLMNYPDSEVEEWQ